MFGGLDRHGDQGGDQPGGLRSDCGRRFCLPDRPPGVAILALCYGHRRHQGATHNPQNRRNCMGELLLSSCKAYFAPPAARRRVPRWPGCESILVIGLWGPVLGGALQRRGSGRSSIRSGVPTHPCACYRAHSESVRANGNIADVRCLLLCREIEGPGCRWDDGRTMASAGHASVQPWAMSVRNRPTRRAATRSSNRAGK